MNEPLPARSVIPKPGDVRLELLRLGYGHVDVFSHPELGCMIQPGSAPDAVWLAALKAAGASPLPCVACYTAGDGSECAGGRCRRPGAPTSRLVLPPGFGG